MAVVYADFVRERGRGGRTVKTYVAKAQRAKAYQRASAAAAQRVAVSAPTQRGGLAFWSILLLAPLAGLVAPLIVAPLAGEMSAMVMGGAGLFACVMLLFWLAKQEADSAPRATQ